MSKQESADRMSARIKALTIAYEAQFGRKPEALFVPPGMSWALIDLAEDICGRLLDEGFVLDSINGLEIRLVTGNRLGVGILSGKALELGRSTPIQDAVWI
jgi:hypothetical protein